MRGCGPERKNSKMGGFAGMTMVAAFRHLLAVGAALRRDRTELRRKAAPTIPVNP